MSGKETIGGKDTSEPEDREEREKRNIRIRGWRRREKRIAAQIKSNRMDIPEKE